MRRSRWVAVVLVVVALVGSTAGVALAVVGGRTIPIAAAPWTVVIREYGQPRCTGVIISSFQILTAGHCVMSDGGNSGQPLPPSDFTVEAGVSNFKHQLKSDRPQLRSVSAVRAMPGYIAGSKRTLRNYMAATAHDLAVLTLSRRLDLDGDDAHAAYLPTTATPKPWGVVRLVMAGFGAEKSRYHVNGTLNEVVKSTVRRGCSASEVLCIYQRTSTCFGDSGSGAVEPGPRSTVIGIFSAAESICRPGLDYYVFLTTPATLRFIKTNT